MWQGEFSSPQSQYKTKQFYNIADKRLTSVARTWRDSQRQIVQPSPARALCAGWDAGRVWRGGGNQPRAATFTCQWSNQSSSDLAGWRPLSSQALSFVLLITPRSPESADCQQTFGKRLANSLWGICHPLQAPSLGKYISHRQAGFSNYPTPPRWERWML